MIKIKNYIFNKNEILQIYQGLNNTIFVLVKYTNKEIQINNCTFKDIEWNYGTPQETQRQMQKELCKSCYYRDTISNEVERLEKSNKTFEDYNKDLNRQIEKLEEEISKKHIREVQQKNIEYAGRINKAIELINDNVAVCAFGNEELPHWEFEDYEIQDLLKILKGESNEN